MHHRLGGTHARHEKKTFGALFSASFRLENMVYFIIHKHRPVMPRPCAVRVTPDESLDPMPMLAVCHSIPCASHSRLGLPMSRPTSELTVSSLNPTSWCLALSGRPGGWSSLGALFRGRVWGRPAEQVLLVITLSELM